MTGSSEPEDDAVLGGLFDAARAAAPVPSAALLDRIASDAADQQTGFVSVPAPAVPSWVSRLRDMLGGWTGIGGLAAATVAGFYIGFAQPEPLGLALVTVDEIDVADVTSWTDSAFWPLDDLSFEEG